MSDRIFGALALLLSIFYIWAATIIPDSFILDAIGPRVFAYIIGIIGIVCGLVFILQPDPEPNWPPIYKLAEIGAATLALSIYTALLPLLGFLIATSFATAYLTWRLGSSPLSSIKIGVLTSAGIYIVFRLILGLSLATSPFGF
ncbi:MAG: tripartite tricarboxylate transporter TctB family protein [Pontibacterium sp.]